jgi:hypothetical protein
MPVDPLTMPCVVQSLGKAKLTWAVLSVYSLNPAGMLDVAVALTVAVELV